jgi:hypothetical protein
MQIARRNGSIVSQGLNIWKHIREEEITQILNLIVEKSPLN